VDLRLVLGLRGAACLYTKEEEGLEQRDKAGVTKGLKEADVDTITAITLLP
jgi:hypothetical protein